MQYLRNLLFFHFYFSACSSRCLGALETETMGRVQQIPFSESSDSFPSSHFNLVACPLQASAPRGEKFLLAYCLLLTGTLLFIPGAWNAAFSSCLIPWQQAMVTAFLVVKGKKRLITFLSLKPFVCN